MRKLNVLLLVLGIAIILTGCDLFGSDESINAQKDIVVINFDSHSAKGMSLNTQYPEVAELYWSYTAEKKDNKPKYGEKLAPANIKDGTGCNKNIEFSTGKWEFVLYGFTTADARTKSNTVELAEKNCTYTGKVEKELKKTDTAVTVYTAVNSNSDTYGTIKVSVTTSPTNSNKTVKYYITNVNGYSTTWTSIPGQENTSATDGYTVYLGLFDETGRNVGETSITNIRVDAGLTTEISGTWDVSFIEGGIDIIGPWNVKFESVLGKSIQNQSVKNGECAKKPADLTEGEQIRGVIGTTDAIYKFAGWAETENGTPVNVTTIHITADKTFYAVWTKVSDAPNVWNVKFETRIPNHVIPNQLVENGKYAVTPSDFKVGDEVCVIMGSTHYFWGWSTTITDITSGSLADKTVDVDTIPITTDTTFYAVWGESHTDSKTLLFIDVTVSPIDYVFSEGDDVKEHLIVKGYYSDSSENIITDTDYSTDITTVTSSTNMVTVSYTEGGITKTKDISITNKTLIGIEVTTNTDTFIEGKNIRNYLTVQSVHSDGTKVIRDNYTVSPTDIVSFTTNTVTVSYTESGITKSKDVSFTVVSSGSGITLNEIEVTTDKDIFYEGDNIKDYLTVKGFYTNGFERIVPKEDYSTNLPNDKVTSTTNSVTVTYTDCDVTKTKSISIKVFSDIEVITETDVFFEGENIKDFITVKSVYSDGSKKTLSDTDYSISPSEIVYSTNTSLEISYTEKDIEKKKSINITLGNLSDYVIDEHWFNNFSGVDKKDVTSISFLKEKPSDETELVKKHNELSYYKKGNNLYVVGRKLIFDSKCSHMFKDFSNVKTIDLSEVDTSKVTYMNGMFYNCSNLTSLDLSGFNTSKVTDMGWMFKGCSQLTSLDLSSFNITSTTDRPSVTTSDMFGYVPTTIPIYVSNVDDWTSLGGWNFQIKTTP